LKIIFSWANLLKLETLLSELDPSIHYLVEIE